jgi:hypothetical protein
MGSFRQLKSESENMHFNAFHHIGKVILHSFEKDEIADGELWSRLKRTQLSFNSGGLVIANGHLWLNIFWIVTKERAIEAHTMWSLLIVTCFYDYTNFSSNE